MSLERSHHELLDRLSFVEFCCLIVVLPSSLYTFAAWLVPALHRLLPADWVMMQANTALAVFLSALSLVFSTPRRSSRSLWISRILASLVALLAISVLTGYLWHLSFGIDELLTHDPSLTHSGSMSPHSAIGFLLLSISLLLVRQRRRSSSLFADLFTCAFCLWLLVILSGYLFGALHLFGAIHTTPQTMVSLFLLSFVTFVRRMESGTFSVLLGSGLGGRMARAATPVAFLVPFLLEALRSELIRNRVLTQPYATALVAAMAAMLTFALVIALARRIDRLETEIRDLSLRDELTQVYNRRGLYLVAEQGMLMARRAKVPFSVLFIDLDSLKQVNDSLGHEVGSHFISEAAQVLKGAFRKTDIIGRIGGDEFVVAGNFSQESIGRAAHALDKAIIERNAQPDRHYPFSFSCGCATIAPGEIESLEHLIDRADHAMYEVKQRRKAERARNEALGRSRAASVSQHRSVYP